MGRFGEGQSIRRIEDQRLLTGEGRYTDDIDYAHVAHAAFVRSPHAHARIVSIDLSAAKAAPGVLAAYDGADYARAGYGPIPCLAPIKNADGSEIARPPRHGLAQGVVRHVGDTVAMVVAESVAAARDAADLIDVRYEALPHVTDPEAALRPDAARVWPDEAPDNLCFDWALGDQAAVAAAFDKAAHVTRARIVNNRIVAAPMEPRACVAEYDDESGRYTFRYASQGVFGPKNILAKLLNVTPDKVRVLTGDVGGGFGMKIFIYPEYPSCLFAAKALGRPVKWISDRSEAFLTDVHGRDHVTEAEIALDAEGRILAIRADTLAEMGAYASQFGPAIPTIFHATMLTSVYRIPALAARVRGVFTHTTPVDAYRGAGRPEAVYCIERLIDQAAAETGRTREALRRVNFIPSSAMPWAMPGGLTFDSGEFGTLLDQTMARADWAGLEARKAASAAKGRLRGGGIAYYTERTGGQPKEFGRLTVKPDGKVRLVTGTQSNGQGHETAFAQLIAERMGLDVARIEVAQGDSDELEFGGGTGGSRSLTMSGGALDLAWEAAEEAGRAHAAEALEAALADIEYDPAGAAYRIAGTDRAIGLFEVAGLAGGDGLTGEAIYEHGIATLPNGAHVCEIEIDPETGVIAIERYTTTEDFGCVLNPMLVEGQVHGGVGQGVGQAMCERVVFDHGSGQPLAGSFMDYRLPRAADLPSIDFAYSEAAPCVTNPLGVKGCGEAGAIGAPPALVSAVLDALKPRGVSHIDMPLTPEKIWRACRGEG